MRMWHGTVVVLACTWLLLPQCAKAQGYEWEWSPRQPQHMPTRYVGLEAVAGYALQQSDLLYSELTLPCCSFTGGRGIPFSFALQAEQWIEPWLAITAALGASYQQSWLVAEGDTLPRISPDNVVRMVITEWQLDASVSYLTLSGGARARLFNTHAAVGLQVRGSFALSSKAKLAEKILAPDDFYFQYQGQTTKMRDVDSSTFAQRSSFYVEPVLSLQYDVPLSTGYVLTPLMQFSVPLTSLAATGTWRYYSVGFGVRLSRGM